MTLKKPNVKCSKRFTKQLNSSAAIQDFHPSSNSLQTNPLCSTFDMLQLGAYLQQAKVAAKTKKIKEPAKKIKENTGNIKENFRFRCRFYSVWI